jgi:hypothetical protein
MHAQFGSTVGSDTNDPTQSTFEGTNYVYFFGTTGEDFRTPDTAALDITGDIGLMARIQCDITPGAINNLISKFDSSTTGSYSLRLNTDSKLSAVWVDQVPASNSHTSSATLSSVGITDNQKIWIAWTLDVDNGASGNDSKFWYSTTDTNDYTQVVWTQLGTTQTGGAITNIQNSVEELQVGARKDNAPAAMYTGKLYWAGVFNQASTSTGLVAEFNPSTGTIHANHTTIINGAYTWTRTLAATGKHIAIVNESKLVFGVDDYLEIADNALLDFNTTDDFTVIVSARSHDSSDGLVYFHKVNATPDDGWSLITYLGTATLGTTYANTAPGASAIGALPADGARHVVTYRRIAGSEASVWLNGTEGTPVALLVSQDATTSEVLRIGTAAGAYADMEFMKAAIFRRALSDAEILQVVSEMAL